MSMRLAEIAATTGKKPSSRSAWLKLLPGKDYSDGRTKQSFKDETNINKLLERAQRSGTLSHLEKHGATYGEMADFDLFEAQLRIRHAQESFDALPSEIRNEFHNSPAAFFKFVNDPANKDDLAKKLPALAKPGRQNIDVSGKSDPTPEVEKAAQAAQPSPEGGNQPPPDPT